MSEQAVVVIILLLAAATILKVGWPIIEGIFKSLLELFKVVLTLAVIGGGIILLANL